MSIKVDVQPAVLRWAATRAGWDEEQRQEYKHFNQWVEQERKPTLKQLEKFAQATHTPFGALFLEQPPEETIPIPDMRTLRNEALHEASADLIDTIHLCQNRQAWFRDYAIAEGLEKPNFVGMYHADIAAEVAAENLRGALGLEWDRVSNTLTRPTDVNEMLRTLIGAIERLGVLVMISGIVGANTHRPLNVEQFRGFALVDNVAPLIFVNGQDSKKAQVFTLLHEFGHLLLGESALSSAHPTAPPRPTNPHQLQELWCNRFAAELLVPVECLRREYTGIPGEEELSALSHKFQVSTLVVLQQLRRADLISSEQQNFLYELQEQKIAAYLEEHSGDPKPPGGNFYYTLIRRLGSTFTEAVVDSTLAGKTYYRDAYKLLGVTKANTFDNLVDRLRGA